MKKLYCLYDKVAKSSNEPMLISTEAAAVRLFKNTCRRELAANPFAPVGDMELHYLADYDDTFGVLIPPTVEVIEKGLNVVFTGDKFLEEENKPQIVGYETPKKSVQSKVVNEVEAQQMKAQVLADDEED